MTIKIDEGKLKVLYVSYGLANAIYNNFYEKAAKLTVALSEPRNKLALNMNSIIPARKYIVEGIRDCYIALAMLEKNFCIDPHEMEEMIDAKLEEGV